MVPAIMTKNSFFGEQGCCSLNYKAFYRLYKGWFRYFFGLLLYYSINEIIIYIDKSSSTTLDLVLSFLTIAVLLVIIFVEVCLYSKYYQKQMRMSGLQFLNHLKLALIILSLVLIKRFDQKWHMVIAMVAILLYDGFFLVKYKYFLPKIARILFLLIECALIIFLAFFVFDSKIIT